MAPFRHMITRGGFGMSVGMTNCGSVGQNRISLRRGRPGERRQLATNAGPFFKAAKDAAAQAGFSEFVPDACLINRYEPGTRLSLHQDKNKRDFGEPIVSVSLGIPALFLFGGSNRADKPSRVQLTHGDVMVWVGRPGFATTV
jgi:DNA oxidative demethylase